MNEYYIFHTNNNSEEMRASILQWLYSYTEFMCDKMQNWNKLDAALEKDITGTMTAIVNNGHQIKRK